MVMYFLKTKQNNRLLLALLRSFSGVYIFFFKSLEENNSFTTPFSRGELADHVFSWALHQFSWALYQNYVSKDKHLQPTHTCGLWTSAYKVNSIKRKREVMLHVFYFYMLKDKCVYFRLVLKYPKRQ